jgi:hypothetical protein
MALRQDYYQETIVDEHLNLDIPNISPFSYNLTNFADHALPEYIHQSIKCYVWQYYL